MYPIIGPPAFEKLVEKYPFSGTHNSLKSQVIFNFLTDLDSAY
jgi:hypothetical protein